jgi:hypothetical protein
LRAPARRPVGEPEHALSQASILPVSGTRQAQSSALLVDESGLGRRGWFFEWIDDHVEILAKASPGVARDIEHVETRVVKGSGQRKRKRNAVEPGGFDRSDGRPYGLHPGQGKLKICLAHYVAI